MLENVILQKQTRMFICGIFLCALPKLKRGKGLELKSYLILIFILTIG